MSLGETLAFRSVRARAMRAKMPAPKHLSMRHVRTAEFVAAGMRNKEIADRLDVTVGTIKVYVSEIYAMSHLTSRVQIANWVLERDRDRDDAGQAVRLLNSLGVVA